MAITQNTYTGNGSTVLYSFTFPYLETTDIKVSLNGVDTTAYTLANATTVQFNSAPANGAAIRIYRQTDDAGTKATFFPGSAIRSQDLNDNFLQVLYKSQETETFATSTDASAIQETANTALANSNTAITTANAASATANGIASTANTALGNSNTAVSTANTANSTANTANSNATSALAVANAALPKTGGTLTGAVATPLGSTTAPSLTFSGDTNTGIYSPGTDQVGISTGGVQRVNFNAATEVVFNDDGENCDFRVEGDTQPNLIYVDASADRVGIGTASPSDELHVSGTGRFHELVIGETGTADAAIEVGAYGTGNRFAYLDLIGDTTYSDFGCRLLRGNAGANATSELLHRGTGDLVVKTKDAAPIVFYTNDAERLRIQSAGKVVCAGNIEPDGYVGRSGTGGTTSNPFNIFWTGSAAKLYIDNVDQGTISTSSDYRIKKNVKPIEADCIERVKQLRPVEYEIADYGTLFKADGIVREGFIAHEVQEVIPSGAEGNKDEKNKIQNLRTDAIVAVLTKALQEAVDRIETLEAAVAALETA